MGEAEARAGSGARSDFRHDSHTVSLLTDHVVFPQRYRGKVLLGEMVEAAKEIIRKLSLAKKQGKRCGKKLDVEVIDISFQAHRPCT